MHAQTSPPNPPNNKISQLLIREQYNHTLTALLCAVIICVEHNIFYFFV